MQRAASYPSVPGQPRTLAIAGSLLLVSLSYVLLLAAPVITRHFRSLAVGQAGLKAFEAWLPLACGAGLVLGGASALVFVLTQITREAQRRPYISLAPVLAAFSACVLIGLRAELPLPGVSSEHVAVFALAVAVVGGALVQTPRVSAQLLGVACTFLPVASLFGVLWLMSGNADPARAVWGLPASTRAYLGMLTLSSFAIAAVATLGRRGELAADAGPGLATRLPSNSHSYASYDLEQSLAEDEAALARRGLPGWLIAATAGAALVLSFMAVKLYLERRAANSMFENEAARSAPVPAEAQPATTELGTGPASEPIQPTEAVVALPMPTTAAEHQAEAAPSTEPVRAEPARVEPKAEQPAAAPAEQPVHAIAPVAPSAPAQTKQPSIAARSHSPKAALKTRLPRTVVKASSAHKAAPAAPEPAQVTAKQAAPVVAPKPVKEDSASIALKAARAVSDSKPSATPHAADTKPAASRGDESLDDLMDNVLKPSKGTKKREASNDDPIYGL